MPNLDANVDQLFFGQVLAGVDEIAVADEDDDDDEEKEDAGDEKKSGSNHQYGLVVMADY